MSICIHAFVFNSISMDWMAVSIHWSTHQNVESKHNSNIHIWVLNDSSYSAHPFEQVSLAIDNRPSFWTKPIYWWMRFTCEHSTNICVHVFVYAFKWMNVYVCLCDGVYWLVFINSIHIFDGKCCVLYNKRVEESLYVCIYIIIYRCICVSVEQHINISVHFGMSMYECV